MADIYKIAAQSKLRFPAKIGGSGYMVEDLFELPLQSRNGHDLDTVAKTINNEIKTITEGSFVAPVAANPRKTQLEVSLEIVIDVIKTKQAENAAQLAKLDNATKRKKILDIINAKQDEALSASSLDDLKKQLAELG
jgi:hypothetical protein